ncbi:MAG: hypothetical protein OJF49_001301 [Ktedonobacterales bacterium]|nr:MAG: hypothetical protein OJF49_001301 [Ktedonobacterales bacterium]
MPTLEVLGTPSVAVLRAREYGIGIADSADVRGLRGGRVFLAGGRVFAISGDVATLGRDLKNSVVLLDPAVSREHARLRRIAGGWLVENASARGPVWVGERRLAPGEMTEILPGEWLTLGDTQLQFLAPELRASAADTPGEAPAGSSGTRVLGLGITLQFALREKRGARAWWAFALVVLGLLLASALVTLGTVALVGRDAAAASGVGHVLAALTIPLAPALGALLLVAAFDRYEREPWLLLLGAFVWGALVAIPPAFFVEHAVSGLLLGIVPTAAGPLPGLGAAAAQALSAGLTEEVTKGAGLLLLIWALRDEFDNVTDGILYGLLIGAGFAMVENFVYFAQSPGGSLPVLIAGRVALGWLSHSTFTAFFGAGLGYAREQKRRCILWLAPLGGLAVAVLLHMEFDFVAFAADVLARQPLSAQDMHLLALCATTLAYLPLFGAQAVLLWLLLGALRREAAIVREYLAPEVVAGTVLPDEYALMQRAKLRGRAERRALFEFGARPYLTARALHQTITGLAFRAWHVAQGDPPKRGTIQPEDAYRTRIARLRASLLRQTLAAYAADEANGAGDDALEDTIGEEADD